MGGIAYHGMKLLSMLVYSICLLCLFCIEDRGRREWFQKEAILSENPSLENLGEVLGMIKLIAGVEHMTPEQRLTEVQRFIQAQLSTLYPRK